jgi:formate/nitrite transporter FocA (FNT family)
MSDDTSRMNVHEIFETAVESARDELARSTLALGVSGLAGGITMGLTGLGVATVQAALGEGKGADLAAMLLYPLGFLAVIIGRAQLFTENTLYPVVLVLKERRHLFDCLRLWAAVFVMNIVGTLIFALLASHTGALSPEIRGALVKLGVNSVHHDWSTIFWTGVIGGWLIALVAWLVTASHWTSSQMMIVYALTFLMGAGHFAHCIAGSGEILTAVLQREVQASTYFAWLACATLGNIAGGVVIVSLLNFGQVHAE